jgi:hypothetical protein
MIEKNVANTADTNEYGFAIRFQELSRPKIWKYQEKRVSLQQ